jgi:hypothetical protein
MTYVDIEKIPDTDLNVLKTYYFGDASEDVKLITYYRKNDFIWDTYKNGYTIILFEAPNDFYNNKYRDDRQLQDNTDVKSFGDDTVIFISYNNISPELA